jgi:predicted dehydrogenase
MQLDFSLPRSPRPIIIIGTGGIVNDAHLPAYKLAGFNVAGLYDINIAKAIITADKFSIPVVYENLEQMLKNTPQDVVFDMAVPGNEIIGLLQKLSDEATVLIQKPMGENYEQAKQILQITRDKK